MTQFVLPLEDFFSARRRLMDQKASVLGKLIQEGLINLYSSLTLVIECCHVNWILCLIHFTNPCLSVPKIVRNIKNTQIYLEISKA